MLYFSYTVPPVVDEIFLTATPTISPRRSSKMLPPIQKGSRWIHSCLAYTDRQCLSHNCNKMYQRFIILVVIYLCYPVWGCYFTVTPQMKISAFLISYLHLAALFANLSVNYNCQYFNSGWFFLKTFQVATQFNLGNTNNVYNTTEGTIT